MFRLLIIRFRRRRAVSMIIGGMIILSLIITVLGTMVFVSQQYDQYQHTSTSVENYREQQQSEYLVANSPGLIFNQAWNGCGGCNMYNMTVSNLGGVGIQIVTVYIISTGSGCLSLCTLPPSSSSTTYVFKKSMGFINPGEINHSVLLYLPSTVFLPSGTPNLNTVLIATSRGNDFSFQWPFQNLMGGQSQSAFSAGILKVAYTGSGNPGYDSMNELGPVNSGSGGTHVAGYCHTESQTTSQTSERPQKFTGTGYGDGGVLWFVNPWMTQTFFTDTCNSGCTSHTSLYIYVNITNTGTIAYSPVAGTLDLTWYGSNHIDGTLIGSYDSKGFHSTTSGYTYSSGSYFYALFQVTTVALDTGNTCPQQLNPTHTWPPCSSVMFWGSLSLTNNLESYQFVSGVALSSGLWIRVPGC